MKKTKRLLAFICICFFGFIFTNSKVYGNDENVQTESLAGINRSTHPFLAKLDNSSIFMIVVIGLLIIVIAGLIFGVAFIRKAKRKVEIAYKKEQEALAIAESANLAKGSFLSRMSHEIRTPLNAIIGYSAIAKTKMKNAKTEADRKQAEMNVMDCLSKSDIASKHLLTIINDILDMAAIESGKIKLAHERFDFKTLINALTTIFYSQARAKDITFDVKFDTMTEEWFIGDALRISQVLTNLLSNAIKFTPEGGKVLFIIKEVLSTEKVVKMEFTVQDNGIGMEKEFLNHVWIPFEQAEASTNRKYGGTGLGMPITKNLVELMQGTITVESEIDVGTTFVVRFDLERTPQPDDYLAFDYSGIKALIVDDDPSTCDYIRLLFEKCGAKCEAYTSGMEAIQAYADALKTNNKFNLCLVDWKMPKMNGIETIKKIKDMTTEDVPIIVLTAYDFIEIASKAKQIGIKLFISKPLFQSSLYNLLADISGRRVTKEEKVVYSYDFSDSRILLAEDNEMNMEIQTNILRSVGLTVDTVYNGQDALNRFLASTPGTYQAILMDIQMPIMDGHDAAKAIRNSSHPEGKTIPIIAITADAFAENVAESIAVGMNDHISKPIDVDAWLQTLSKYL